MKIIKILNDKFEEIFLVILMVAAVGVVAAQVFTRYVLKIPLAWSEETARYMFLWLIWIGSAYATKERKHIKIDVLIKKLPGLGKRACHMITTAIWILFVIFMAVISFQMASKVFEGGAIAVGSGIPMWVPYAAIPVGMALMLIRLVQNCYEDLKNSKKEVQS